MDSLSGCLPCVRACVRECVSMCVLSVGAVLPPAPVNGEAGILAPGRIRQLDLNKQRKTGGGLEARLQDYTENKHSLQEGERQHLR